jgi:hypothetical protein
MIKNKDAGKLVKDGGDILELFKAAAEENAVTVTEERLAAGHANRINESLLHVGRGVEILQALMALAARRPSPQTTPVGLAHEAPPAGPAAEQAAGGPPLKTLMVEGDIVIDRYKASDFFEAEAVNLMNFKAAILDAARDSLLSKKEFPILFAKARESLAAGVAADRGVVLRSEVNEAIVQPVLAWARKAIENRLMVGKSLTPNGRGVKSNASPARRA